MKKIRLELNSIDLERNKKRWSLYMIIATENPENPDEMLMTLLPPEKTISLRNPADNYIKFVPEGEGADGLSVLERLIPEDNSVKARLWLMHSRKGLRNIGDIMTEFQDHDEVNSIVEGVSTLGNFNPWISLGLNTLGAVGKFLAKVKDRELGYVSMDEAFHPEKETGRLERANQLSTGFGKISWAWIVED